MPREIHRNQMVIIEEQHLGFEIHHAESELCETKFGKLCLAKLEQFYTRIGDVQDPLMRFILCIGSLSQPSLTFGGILR